MNDDKASTCTISIFDADGNDITEESIPGPSYGSDSTTFQVEAPE